MKRNCAGWTQGLGSRVEYLYRPTTEWDRLEKRFVRLPDKYARDLEAMRATVAAVRSCYSLESIIVNPVSGKRRRTYRGIGLTARPHSVDPLYEAVRYYSPEGSYQSSAKGLGSSNVNPENPLRALDEREFSVANQVAPDLVTDIKAMFQDWSVSKVRLVDLLPGGVVPPHYDHAYYQQIRLHYVVETNPDVFWEVDGESFQIPADGALYWFDTGLVHSICNFGKTVRTVLSIHLEPPEREPAPGGVQFLRSLENGLL